VERSLVGRFKFRRFSPVWKHGGDSVSRWPPPGAIEAFWKSEGFAAFDAGCRRFRGSRFRRTANRKTEVEYYIKQLMAGWVCRKRGLISDSDPTSGPRRLGQNRTLPGRTAAVHRASSAGDEVVLPRFLFARGKNRARSYRGASCRYAEITRVGYGWFFGGVAGAGIRQRRSQRRYRERGATDGCRGCACGRWEEKGGGGRPPSWPRPLRGADFFFGFFRRVPSAVLAARGGLTEDHIPAPQTGPQGLGETVCTGKGVNMDECTRPRPDRPASPRGLLATVFSQFETGASTSDDFGVPQRKNQNNHGSRRARRWRGDPGPLPNGHSGTRSQVRLRQRSV